MAYQLSWLIRQVSPDKNVIFLLMYPPKSTAITLGGFGLRLDVETRPTMTASNWIRVPRVEHLPLASSRFYLAIDTLAFS